MKFPKSLLVVILVLALTTMACGININLPFTQIKTGPTQTDDISIPFLTGSGTVADLTLAFGAGELQLAPGAKNNLVEGTATYNVPDFKPEISTSGHNVRIEQGNLNVSGIPSFRNGMKNNWDLKLADRPMKLTINAGAYNGNYDLGGLSLQDLDISDGASNVNLDFSEPNQAEMDTFRYTTGASSITLTNLANANFDTMIFHSGAGSYELNFDGDLQRDANVQIESGISSIKVSVPKGVSAEVSFEGALSNVNVSGAWEKNGNTYTQSGSGPTISITIKMGAGSVNLKN